MKEYQIQKTDQSLQKILLIYQKIKYLKCKKHQITLKSYGKNIKFLQDKFFSSNKYDNLIDELHEEEIIDDDLEVIQNEFSSYNSKDDDFKQQFYGKIILNEKINRLVRCD